MFRFYPPKVKPRPTTKPTWKRCGFCGKAVEVPADPRGLACKKCGGPLSMARPP